MTDEPSPKPNPPAATLPTDPINGLTFTNRFTTELPGDPQASVRPRQVLEACWSPTSPTPTERPSIVAVAPEMAETLGLDDAALQSDAFVRAMSGNAAPDGAEMHAMAYGGHQFGNWAGQLGDGRAMALGEVRTPAGDHLTLQLKGAGRTPYSRGADGRAVLRSSIREYLCSEAMHHLGVPTTRALSLALTGDQVVRDVLYSGNPAPEHGAVVCRVAPSFIRFGNFQLFAARDDIDTLRALTDFTIATEFAHLGAPSPETYAAFFAEVAERTADLMAHWMGVGFVHGVMNTDNLSISGLTIDYGPYGWLEDFDPDWTPNTTDASHRRYRYGQQPAIGQWNLARLAEALHPLIGSVEPLQDTLDTYASRYDQQWTAIMSAKLGISNWSDSETDRRLLDDLLALLAMAETDMTIFFRELGNLDAADASSCEDPSRLQPMLAARYDTNHADEWRTAARAWFRSWGARVTADPRSDSDRRDAMHAVNPRYVLRNWIAQEVIDDADTGDYTRLERVAAALRTPFTDQPENDDLYARRPEWARTRVGCSMLSCSS